MKKILLLFLLLLPVLRQYQCPEFKLSYQFNEERPIGFEVDGSFIYLLNLKNLIILEHNEKEIIEISKIDINYEPLNILKVAKCLFILDSSKKIHFYDISNPRNIFESNQVELEKIPLKILSKNNFIYILFESSLKIFKIFDYRIELISLIDFESKVIDGILKDDLIFLALNSNEIISINIEDSEYPFIFSIKNFDFKINNLISSDEFLIATYNNGYFFLSLYQDDFLNIIYEEKNIKNIKFLEIIGSYFLTIFENNDFFIYEIDEIYNPKLLSNFHFDGEIFSLKTKGSFVYLINEKELKIFDINNCCEEAPKAFSIYKPLQKRNYFNEIIVTFDWSDSQRAVLYDLYLDTKNPPEQKFLEDLNISKAEIILNSEGYYYFQVRAKNGCGEISSETKSFYLAPPGPFELIYPDDGAENLPTEILFDWTDSQDTNYYELYLGKTIPPPLYQTGIFESQLFVSNLKESTTYYWYVKAINNEGSSTTRKRSFKTSSPELHLESNYFYDSCIYGGLGNSNNIMEPGERINLYLGISNSGFAKASNVNGTIEILTSGVFIEDDFAVFPDIPPDGQTYFSLDPFIFEIPQNFQCMNQIQFRLTLNCTNNSFIENFNLNVGEKDFKLIYEKFDNWPPQNFQIKNNGGNCVWESTSTTGLPNYTGGEGPAAVADSDWCGEGTQMDTELWTPTFNLPYASTSTICLPYGSPPLPYATAATLEFKAAYRDSGTELDNFKVEISKDGGSFWETLLFWNEDHSPLGPGELVKIDLTPYAGFTNLFIRFVYKALDWLWWTEVDDVEINIPYACTKCGPGPQNFNLIYPQNGQTGLPLSLTLKWEQSENATCYNLYLGNINPPPIYASFINQNQININLSLSYTWYYWQVEAVNEFGLKKSEIYSFRTKSLNGPMEVPDGTLKAEKDGNLIKLSWAQTCGTADDYTIYEGDLNLLSNGIYNHYSIVCSDVNKDLQETFYPSQENAYYLVVPRTQEGIEGSYGKNIPQGADMANCGITNFQPEECPASTAGNYIYYGYHQQTNNGDWEGFINSPLDFRIENGYLTEISPNDYGIVYITPQSYVMLLSNNYALPEPLLLVYGNFYEINYHINYFNDSGNLILAGDYHYILNYLGNIINGTMDVNIISFDPLYNPVQGHYYFNFEAGIIGEGNGTGKFLGYNMQINNGNWEGFINSPLNITLQNWNINALDEDDKKIVYITPSNYVIMLGYGQFFSPPIQIQNGEPFNISYLIEYTDDVGNVVITGDYVIDGTFNNNYLTGNINATIKALNPAYKAYQGKWYWNFEGGIKELTVANLNKKKERSFKILMKELEQLKLKLKDSKVEIKKDK